MWTFWQICRMGQKLEPYLKKKKTTSKRRNYEAGAKSALPNICRKTQCVKSYKAVTFICCTRKFRTGKHYHWENSSCLWTRQVVIAKRATAFTILSLCNSPLIEAVCPAISLVLLSDHAFWRYLHAYACSLTRLSARFEGLNTGSCVEILSNEHDSFSHWWIHLVQVNIYLFVIFPIFPI